MIKNQREYRITRAQADKFEQALEALAERQPARGEDPGLPELQAAALRSQLDDLREQLAEYEALRDGGLRVVAIETLEELRRAGGSGRVGRDSKDRSRAPSAPKRGR